MATYKQLCNKCKKNFIIVNGREKYALCYDCQKKYLEGEIKSEKMKALFDIPEEYYKDNLFLRNIKIYYLRFGKLSEKQINAFKKTIESYKSKK